MSTVANFFAPSDLSGISGTKCEYIYAINRWRNSPGHFDTLFVNAAPDDMDDDDDDDSSAHMIQGLEIAPAHLVFSFTLGEVPMHVGTLVFSNDRYAEWCHWHVCRWYA